MKRQLLFVHGGGEGAYEEDRKMAASLREALGRGKPGTSCGVPSMSWNVTLVCLPLCCDEPHHDTGSHHENRALAH